MSGPAFIVRELRLSGPELARAIRLLQAGVIRRHLLECPREMEGLFSVDRLSRQVLIAGPAELVVRLQTMIEDELTFLLATRRKGAETTLAVLSLVDPIFLEADSGLALQILEDNYAGVTRILKPQSDDYRRAGKRVCLNAQTGTVTILDSPRKIEEVRKYLALRPYAPRPGTY